MFRVLIARILCALSVTGISVGVAGIFFGFSMMVLLGVMLFVLPKLYSANRWVSIPPLRKSRQLLLNVDKGVVPPTPSTKPKVLCVCGEEVLFSVSGQMLCDHCFSKYISQNYARTVERRRS